MNSRDRKLLIAVLVTFPIAFLSLTYLEDIVEASNAGATGGIVSALAAITKGTIAVASEAGYTGIFLLMLGEAAALPIPSEIILPFAGYLVYQGRVEFWPIITLTTVAALLGSVIDYYIGLKLGHPLLTGRRKLPFISQDHLRQSRIWFDRHGPIAVALFRFVPGARVLISFPAGAYHMNIWTFLIYTLVGCLPWNIVLVYAGLWLGSSWGEVVAVFRYINLAVYALLALVIVWIIRKFRKQGPKSPAPSADHFSRS